MRQLAILAILALSGSASAQSAPLRGFWGAHAFEGYAVWEAPGATRIIWQVIGGGWTQDELSDFIPVPPQFPAHLQPHFNSGVSIGICGYQTTPFPTPELQMSELVDFSRRSPSSPGGGLGMSEVFLFGRSAGAHMSVFNGVVETDPSRRADRVVTIQQPLTLLSLFGSTESSAGLNHFEPTSTPSSPPITIAQIDPFYSYWGSSGIWPLEFPNSTLSNTTRFYMIGPTKDFEAPIPTEADPSVPLPIGSLTLPGDGHSAIAVYLQHFALILGQYDSTYVSTFPGGDPLQEALDALMLP